MKRKNNNEVKTKITLLKRCGDMGVFVDVNGKRYRFNKNIKTVEVESEDLIAFSDTSIFKMED